MPRYKDNYWELPQAPSGNIASLDHVKIALLMDIRDELQEIKQSLGCLRCRNFLHIPRTLNKIARNTERKTKKLDRIGRNTERKKRGRRSAQSKA